MKKVKEKKEVKQPSNYPSDTEMTENEAINQIRLLVCQSCVITDLSNSCARNIAFFPFSLAQNSLEKLIPKKIEKGICNIAFCPVCKGAVWQLKDESKFCFRCGQALDWGDDNVRT